MKGYKVFNSDWTCRNFRYKVGETYKMDTDPRICESGFHFCENLYDCFNYYSFDPENKVAEVDALGLIDKIEGENKVCTNKIKIVRELSWKEVLSLCNTGKMNSGKYNTGDCNGGDRNSGDYNSGGRNSGEWNSGDRNSGNCNSGNRNSGNLNSGDRNSGDWNSGNLNGGNRNSGNWNSGDRNSGDCNSGICNSGSWNSGDWNSGGCNSGCSNSGSCNSGGFNSGDWNSGYRNSGYFNSDTPSIRMFNADSGLCFNDPVIARAISVMHGCPKSLNKGKRQEWWDELPVDKKESITSLPGFDAGIFYKCTLIRI